MLRSDVKKVVKKFDLVDSDLRKFCPLWYKKEDGEIVQGRGPMLYPKLMCDKNLKVYTSIYDKNENPVDPAELIGQKCLVRAGIKIDSVFIGSKNSLQVKVMELEVELQGNQRQRLLAPVQAVYDEPEPLHNTGSMAALAASDSESEEGSDDETTTERSSGPASEPAKRAPAPANRGGKRLSK
jgi:hypothetical protein